MEAFWKVPDCLGYLNLSCHSFVLWLWSLLKSSLRFILNLTLLWTVQKSAGRLIAVRPKIPTIPPRSFGAWITSHLTASVGLHLKNTKIFTSDFPTSVSLCLTAIKKGYAHESGLYIGALGPIPPGLTTLGSVLLGKQWFRLANTGRKLRSIVPFIISRLSGHNLELIISSIDKFPLFKPLLRKNNIKQRNFPLWWGWRGNKTVCNHKSKQWHIQARTSNLKSKPLSDHSAMIL